MMMKSFLLLYFSTELKGSNSHNEYLAGARVAGSQIQVGSFGIRRRNGIVCAIRTYMVSDNVIHSVM
jgi:hypothetical protein